MNNKIPNCPRCNNDSIRYEPLVLVECKKCGMYSYIKELDNGKMELVLLITEWKTEAKDSVHCIGERVELI
jgi:hypothetical protein